MGNWQLEVFKMTMYMAFPVTMFHYFNQPEYYEEYVTKLKRTVFPPVNKQREDELKEAIRKIQEKQDLRILEALEKGINKQ